tara:strand:- start:9 stop:188 length:180 start_codon:yes stop_codon:yes gene_type:complete
MMINLNHTSKQFLIWDDNSPNGFVARFSRTDNEIIPELALLEIGDTYPLSDTKMVIREI